jgi:AraC family transcriptional regulator, ethanolamine operon transcriptional activator
MDHSVSQSFTDLEEFNAFPHGWDINFRPVQNRDGPVRLHHTASENMLINRGEFPGQTLQEGVTPEGMRTFAVPTPGGPEILWMNRKVSSGELMIFNPGGDLRAVTRPGTSICTFSVSDACIEQYMAQQGINEDLLPREPLVLNIGQPFSRVLLGLQSRLSSCIKHDEGQAHFVDARAQEEAQLLDALLGRLVDSRTSQRRIPTHRSAEITFRALDYIDCHKRQLLRVSQICEALGIGRRTLEQSFKQHLAITPKQLINNLRLIGCREELLETDPRHASVSNVAANWGYWHMSQFARDYRSMHDELPSKTLQRQ